MAPARSSSKLPGREIGCPKGSRDKCPRNPKYRIRGESGPARPIPSFPLQEAPRCLTCRQVCKLSATLEGNVNSGAGRSYYYCDNPVHPSRKARRYLHGVFHCYNDDIGILKDSPLCYCKMPARYTRAGLAAKEKADSFACCIKACSWVRYIRHEKKRSYFRLNVFGKDSNANWDPNTIGMDIFGVSEHERRWMAFSDQNHKPNTRIDRTLNPPLPLLGHGIRTRTLLDGTQETFAYSPSTSLEPEQPTTHSEGLRVRAPLPAPTQEIIQIDSSDDETAEDNHVEELPRKISLGLCARSPTGNFDFEPSRSNASHKISRTTRLITARNSIDSYFSAQKATSTAQRRRTIGGAESTRNQIMPAHMTQKQQQTGNRRCSSGRSRSSSPQTNSIISHQAPNSAAVVSTTTSSTRFSTSPLFQESPSFDALSPRQGYAEDGDGVAENLLDDENWESHGTIESSDSEDEDAVNALIQSKAVMLARRLAEVEVARAHLEVKAEPGIEMESGY